MATICCSRKAASKPGKSGARPTRVRPPEMSSQGWNLPPSQPSDPGSDPIRDNGDGMPARQPAGRHLARGAAGYGQVN